MQTRTFACLKKLLVVTTLVVMLAAPITQAFTVTPLPDLTSSSATPSPFNPDEGDLTIEYTLTNAPARIEVYIYDGSAKVRELSAESYKNPGTYSLTWDGMTTNGKAVEKTYSYRIIASNGAGFVYNTVTGPINVQYGSGVSVNVYGDSLTDYEFDPTNNETTTLYYSLNTQADVTVKVKQGSATVETVQNSVSKSAGSYQVVLYGKFGSSEYPEGTYTYEVYATNGSTNDTETGTFTISYNNQTTVNVYGDNLSDYEIDPTNNETTNLTYSINTGADVTVKIKQGSSTIETLKNAEAQSAGTHSVTIDAKDGSINYPEGTYTYEVYATDGSTNDTETGTFVVAYAGGGTDVNVYNNSLTDSEIDPTNNETTTLTYSLNIGADVTVKIKQGSSTIETLKNAEAQSASTHSVVIDAKDGSTNYPEGTYTYEVYATDGSTNDTETGTFVVAYAGGGTAPNVFNDYVTDSEIDPTNNETTTLRYSLNTTATVTVKVKQGSNTVETVFGPESQSAGTHSIVIDAKDGSSDYPEGTYTYEVYATNNDGNDTVTGTFVVNYEGGSGNAPNITNDYADPNPFDPDDENTKIYFTTDKTSDITVEILDGGTVIRTLIKDVTQGAESFSISWNGEDTYENEVDEDTYTYKITACVGNDCDTETGSVEVDYDGTSGSNISITNDYATPNPFDPYDENTKIYFDLNKDADVTIEIKDGSQIERTLLDDVRRYDGTNSSTWNGEDKYGYEMDDGTYTYKITACEVNDSNDCDIETGSVTIDTDGSSNNANLISDIHVNNKIFDPTDGEEAELCFDIEKDNTEITIEVLEGSRLIDTLVDERVYDASNNRCFEWDGEDEDGDIVDDEIYQFRIRAERGSEVEVEYAYTEVDTDGHLIGFPTDNDYCGFYDIDRDSPFCKAIELMEYRGIFSGYPNGYFMPYNDINRAEAVKVILLANDKNILSDNGTDLGYWDVQRDTWYMKYLRTAQREGIAEGYPDSSFKPGDNMNRVELLKVFLETTEINVSYCNYAPYPDTPVTYDTQWYLDYACFAQRYGLMGTDTNGNFNPDQAMTRGDVANLFYQYEQRGLFAY